MRLNQELTHFSCPFWQYSHYKFQADDNPTPKVLDSVYCRPLDGGCAALRNRCNLWMSSLQFLDSNRVICGLIFETPDK